MPDPGAVVLSGAVPFDGHRLRPGCAVVVAGGRIVAVTAQPPDGLARVELDGGILAPGFIDAQVNGGGGVMLNDAPTPRAMARIAAAHRRLGTTALLPTLITDSPEVTAEAMAAVREAPAGVVGLHLEGPHLAPARRGAHLAEMMRPLTDADVAGYIAARRRVRRLLITLAPEMGSPEQISDLARAGVIVSLGHSDASASAAERAFDAGARGVTHLFNAMSGLDHRAPGLATAALLQRGIFAGIIADGHHVDARMVRLAMEAMGNRVFLVTDAMAPVGSAPAQGFRLHGREVRLRRFADGRDRLELEDGTLAGSALDMAGALRFTAGPVRSGLVGQGVEAALRRATSAPARFLRLADRGRLRPGARADLVHLSDTLQVRAVWFGGAPVS
ncbi:MAG: N-acetylglucosamine-6-phosphate deacetylase [Alkalilacustris sp.]